MDSLDNDIVVRFASYLCSRDLVNLSLTCRRFGNKNADGLSLMEDTAKHIICNAQQDERDTLQRMADQSYIELYSELEQYRAPRVFDQLIGGLISYLGNDKSLVECTGYGSTSQTAICNHVMRSGRHYVNFTIVNNSSINIGIVRPLPNWDKKGLELFDPLSCSQNYHELLSERTERWGNSPVHHCALQISYGGYCWSDWIRQYYEDCEWDGSEEVFFDNGDKVGMLLDFDSGTLSLYKNGHRVCVMKDGLSGEYCWTVSMWSNGESVCIEKGSIPN